MKKADLQRIKALIRQEMKVTAKKNKVQTFIAKCENSDTELLAHLTAYWNSLQGVEKAFYKEERIKAFETNNQVKDALEAFVSGLLAETDETKPQVSKGEIQDLENFLKFLVVEKLHMDWDKIKRDYQANLS